MPDPTPTTSAIMPYGTTFTLESDKIDRLITTPDMGSSPKTVNVSSHDDSTYERYIAGRMDVSTFDFEFYMDDNHTNYTTALSHARTNGKHAHIVYPDGTGYTLTGSCTVYHSSTDQSNAEKFKVSFVAETVEETTSNSSSGSGGG